MTVRVFRAFVPALAVTVGLTAVSACSSSSGADGTTIDDAVNGDATAAEGAASGCVDGTCPDASVPPPPRDAAPDTAEPPLDCGPAFASLCAVGARCKASSDCESTCTGGVCDAPSDTDGKKNQGETDVDCGGPNAKKCGVGKTCVTGPDCGLGYCPVATCVAPSSSDTVQNGTETDEDCGGDAQTFDGVTVPAAPKCALAKMCAVDGDCTSAICATNKRCVEAESCRPLHGGYSCGPGELAAGHESCCKSLPVQGLTMMQGGVAKQVYLDKYEITAGRIREWVKAIKAQFGGVPNIQQWVKTRMATDPILAAMYPSTNADFLPAKSTGQVKTFPYIRAPGTITLDIGLEDQLGPTSYYRDVQVNGTSGCGMYAGAYGHRTYWYDAAQSLYFGEIDRGAAAQDVLDEKSMNCITPMMFAAFCAWDGGYMPSQAAIAGAYGAKQWPWGDTPIPQDDVAKITNFNSSTNFNNAKAPRYLFPVVGYDSFASDLSPIIAAPGRFPTDIASQARPAQESWMDLGGNMIEWSQNAGNWYGWTGSSFEGHLYPRMWTSSVYYLDKYGKGGARCMRLQ